MEQKMNTNMDDGTMSDAATGTGKTGKGMMVGMIACAVLAVGGIGFGVYEMIQTNSAKQQISDLKVEIKNQDGTTTTLETDKIEVKEDTKTIVISDSAAAVNAKEYIYIGEWGIKIKIPSTLSYVDYSLENAIDDGNNEYEQDYSSLAIRAIPSNTNPTDAKEFYRISRAIMKPGGHTGMPCFLTSVARYAKSVTNPHGELIFSDDNYSYYYMNGQASCTSSEFSAEGIVEIEQFARTEVINMLSNPDNYSAI